MHDEMIPHGDPEESVTHSPALDRSQDRPNTREYQGKSFLAVVYAEREQAGKVLKALKAPKSPKLIDLADAVFVTRDKRGNIQLQEASLRRKKNTIGDSVAGMMVGAILLAPIDGVTLAGATETVRHKIANVRLEDDFIKELRALMQPDSSTIFLLVQRASPLEVIPRITPYGGTILETFLSQDELTRLEALRSPRVH